MRGRQDNAVLSGRFPGARVGEVVAYDFQLPSSFEPWPGRTRTERTFVLLDLGVSFANPCWVRHMRPGGSANRYTFRDLYIDVMVPTDGRHYRMLDLDEFADAIAKGLVSTETAIDGFRRWRTFLNRHLHAERAPAHEWTDFPPASIRPLLDLPAFQNL